MRKLVTRGKKILVVLASDKVEVFIQPTDSPSPSMVTSPEQTIKTEVVEVASPCPISPQIPSPQAASEEEEVLVFWPSRTVYRRFSLISWRTSQRSSMPKVGSSSVAPSRSLVFGRRAALHRQVRAWMRKLRVMCYLQAMTATRKALRRRG